MPSEADAPKSPVTADGGLPAAPTMEERVRAAKQRYRENQPVHPYEPNPLGKSELSFIADMIAESDDAVEAPQKPQKRSDGPVAPARKGRAPSTVLRGVKASTKNLPDPPTMSGMTVVVDDRVPRGEPQVLPELPAEPTDAQLLAAAGIVPSYSTTEAAQFFDRTAAWMHWGLGRDSDPIFVYLDGTPIVPERFGDAKTSKRRFTLENIRDILLSCYRRGNMSEDRVAVVLRRIHINEHGGDWREREGWRKVRGRWVHPDLIEKVKGVWVRKKKEPSGDTQTDDGD